MPPAFIQALRHDRYAIFLTYTDPRNALGGLERYLADETMLLRNRGVSAVCFFPFPTRRSAALNRRLGAVWGVIVDGRLCGFFDEAGVWRLLSGWGAAGRRPLEIHIHHLRHFDLERVARLLAGIPVAVRLFLHDHFTVCPQYLLLKNNECYCGPAKPSEEKCSGCRYWTPAHHGRIRRVLAAAGDRFSVVAPSPSARLIWAATFPEWQDRIRVLPHLVWDGERPNNDPARPQEVPLRVAYVGAPYHYKGWDLFQQVAGDLSPQRFNYEFYHLGISRTSHSSIRNIPVSIVHEGADAMVRALREARMDVAFLWSIWPETYSYTLQECRLANTWILTHPDSGNIADVVAAESLGRVLPDAGAVRAYLQDVAQVRRDVAARRGAASRLPARAVPNPALLEFLDWNAKPVLPPVPGPIRPDRLAGALYAVKQWKQRMDRP